VVAAASPARAAGLRSGRLGGRCLHNWHSTCRQRSVAVPAGGATGAPLGCVEVLAHFRKLGACGAARRRARRRARRQRAGTASTARGRDGTRARKLLGRRLLYTRRRWVHGGSQHGGRHRSVHGLVAVRDRAAEHSSWSHTHARRGQHAHSGRRQHRLKGVELRGRC
jgi:hypothetical protein